MPVTARPDGSTTFCSRASHSKAFSVLQATDLPPGTVDAAEAEGKCCSNISRYQYPSLVVGGLMGKREAARAKSWSETRFCLGLERVDPQVAHAV